MSAYMQGEAILFLQSAATGMVLYLIYDLLVALRKAIPHPAFLIACEDLFYWIFAGFAVFVKIYRTNQGVLRSFLFLGMLLGAWLCHKTIRSVYERIWVFLFRIPVFFVKKAIKRLLFFSKRVKIFLYHSANKGRVCGKKEIQGSKRGRRFEKDSKEKKKKKYGE